MEKFEIKSVRTEEVFGVEQIVVNDQLWFPSGTSLSDHFALMGYEIEEVQ